jgi:thiol-disulfide isomerase/thioredoxin
MSEFPKDSIPASVDAPDAPVPRRQLLLGLAATAAMLAGAGVAWWKADHRQDAAAGNLDVAFWDMQWETPVGVPLPMRGFAGHPLLLNFWATWCPPCVEELPLINAFYLENKAKGWQVLGLAVDKLAPVQSFLKAMPLDFPVAMAGIQGADLARTLGNASGGLPFSVLIGADGSVLQRKLGRLRESDLQTWAGLK